MTGSAANSISSIGQKTDNKDWLVPTRRTQKLEQRKLSAAPALATADLRPTVSTWTQRVAMTVCENELPTQQLKLKVLNRYGLFKINTSSEK